MMKKNRQIVLFCLFILIFLILSLIIFGYQVLNRKHYTELSLKNRIRMSVSTAPRGKIFSEDKVEIASVHYLYALFLDVGLVKPDINTLKEIAGISEISVDSLNQLIRKAKIYGQTHILLVNGLDVNKLSILEENANLFPDLIVRRTAYRNYPYKELYAHPIGYVGNINNDEYGNLKNSGYALSDFIGKDGIEKYYEEYLRGQNGIQYFEIDETGRMIKEINMENSVNPIPGNDLYTTIVHEMQLYADSLLNGYDAAELIIINPNNGRVMTLISKPSFNPNIFIYGIKKDVWDFLKRNENSPFTNRVIKKGCIPGMIFRIIASISALNENKIDTLTEFQPCTGSLLISDEEFRCWSEHGKLNLLNAIKYDCIIYFAQMSIKLGLTDFLNNAEGFNIGQITGIDLNSESKGFLPDINYFNQRYGIDEWGNPEIIRFITGTKDAEITCLQSAVFISMLINGGFIIKPYIVDSLVSANSGKILYKGEVKRSNIGDIDDNALLFIKNALINAISSETSIIPGANIPKVNMGGFLSINDEYGSGSDAALCLFYPNDNPEFLMILNLYNIEDPRYTVTSTGRKILENYLESINAIH